MNLEPMISIILPARNEGDRIARTLQSIADARTTGCELEFVVVDDASDEPLTADLPLSAPRTVLHVLRLEQQAGVPGARNYGARAARGDILFITDAHVEFSRGWDVEVLRHLDDGRILGATICDTVSSFRGYGCSLIVPFMGTHWNRELPAGGPPHIQIASAAGTVLPRALFEKLGGYDAGMRLYGGAEPEFSVRAWLSGAEIVSVPGLQVLHRFKTKPEIERFLLNLKPHMLHNNLRFGLLYLSELACLQMLRYYAVLYPEFIREAVSQVEAGDFRERRALLEAKLVHDLAWFIRRFNVLDQSGARILE
ncbi:glycosyltransferase involved in cell wall biosynthesis [Paenibacillus mucilaginosus]|uniref:glycosyltransferase n=1 Tax=Paenibacillus mucilaginosus TaxID=61624 RepID=UPI003D1A57C4